MKCVLNDDIFNHVMEKMVQSDALILGSPTYFTDVSAELKALLDRSGFVARGLAKRGITALDVSGGNLVTGPYPSHPDILYPEDQTYFANDAKAIEKVVDVPLILTGGNRTVNVMGKVLAANRDVQAFGMARTLLSEPDLPNKWKADPSVFPRCLACNWCMAKYGKQKTQCVLNVPRQA